LSGQIISFLIGISGALLGAIAVIIAKWIEIRFRRKHKAHERDTELLVQIREHAGWIKERLAGYLPFESYQKELRERLGKIGDLRGLAAHYPQVNSSAMKFANTVGRMWAREMIFESWYEEIQLRREIQNDYNALTKTITKALR